MTRRSRTLVQAVTVLLLMAHLPTSARSQNQTPVTAPRQEKATEGQTQQTPAEVTIPKQEKTTPEPEAAMAAPSPEATTSYTIKQGDTLWDISNTFLKDPFLWPFIWKANPSITNPDLIYPSNKLAIPSIAPIERAMQTPQTPAVAEQEAPAKTETAEEAGEMGRAALQRNQEMGAAPEKPVEEALTKGKLILPEEAATPIIDKYTMLSAGYVGNDESKDVIVGGEEGKDYFGYDDIVYVKIGSKENVDIGDKYVMFDPLNNVKHPVTGKKYGKLIRILGIIQITAKKDASSSMYTARITLSFDVSKKGTMLVPYQEPTPVYDIQQTKTKDISGYILEVMDGRTVNGQNDIVYLDKGSADGVEPGDRFVVYAGQGKVTYPRSLVGETQVIIVKEHTSTAVVRKSTDALVKGDQIEFKK